jgi:predicted RNase H-like HicB family nuclease
LISNLFLLPPKRLILAWIVAHSIYIPDFTHVLLIGACTQNELTVNSRHLILQNADSLLAEIELYGNRAMTMKMLEYYLSLPYTLEVIPDTESSGWMIKIKELPGCMTQADTWGEILPMIEEAKRLWLEVALEHGHRIPEPQAVAEN